MQMKMMPVEQLADVFSDEVLNYLRDWMKNSYAEDVEFHQYKMSLFEQVSFYASPSEKLKHILNKINTKYKFELVYCLSDKIMGESVAKYIISVMMLKFNNAYAQILEYEVDRVNSENNILMNKSKQLKNIIASH